jgi:hypothetical protein
MVADPHPVHKGPITVLSGHRGRGNVCPFWGRQLPLSICLYKEPRKDRFRAYTPRSPVPGPFTAGLVEVTQPGHAQGTDKNSSPGTNTAVGVCGSGFGDPSVSTSGAIADGLPE